MIKAVFFDLYYTLVRYDPSQEELESQALKEFGIEAAPEVFRRPLVDANEFIYQAIAERPLQQRSREEQMALYARYQQIMLEGAGIEADDRLVLGMLAKMQQMKMKLALYDDVAPALDALKKRGMVLGMISNVEHDIDATIADLGLAARLGVIVTSRDAGSNKPRPEIFQAALERAGVRPEEAAYVGDQYQVDCVGAAGAGMRAILIDRGDYFPEITDCPRVRSLTEVADYL